MSIHIYEKFKLLKQLSLCHWKKMNKLNVLIRKQFTFLDEGEITKEVEEKEVQSQKNWKDRYKNIYKNINFFYVVLS